MSWIKIEFQKGNAHKTSRSQTEQTDCEKIREITHEVVKEELAAQQSNQSTPLTKEDIQEAVCKAILQAKDEQEKLENERIKTNKVPLGTKIVMWLLCVIAALLIIVALLGWFGIVGEASTATKIALIASEYLIIAIIMYLSEKYKKLDTTINLLAVLIAFGSLVFSLVS